MRASPSNPTHPLTDRDNLPRHLVVAVVCLAGLLLRWIDVTDPPFDFHPTRQLGSALIARGMYYQSLPSADPEVRQAAIELWGDAPVYEPPLLESLVSFAYRVTGGERLWIARVLSSILWTAGAVPLYLFAQGIGLGAGGVAAVAFYLFLPFGVTASRSFQPDPWMTSSLLYAAWASLRWMQDRTWKWALAAGALGGLAGLVKPVALVPVMGALVGAVWGGVGLRKGLRSAQNWLVALLVVAPASTYSLVSIPSRSGGFLEFWVGPFQSMLLQGSFYVRWVQEASDVVGFAALCLGMAGVWLMPSGSARGLVLGLWVGYGLYSLIFPYQITTHDYYHLMLVGITALSLVPLGHLVWRRIREEGRVAQAGVLTVLAFALSVRAWQSRVSLARDDYRPEAGGWRAIGAELPKDGPTIALTHAYGFPLRYYGWMPISTWPYAADMRLLDLAGKGEFDFAQEFDSRIEGYRYFLVTDFAELDAQPDLRGLLERYEVSAEGEAYVVFDLARPRP